MSCILNIETVNMMVNEYDPDPKYNQERALYDNLYEVVKSHEALRTKLAAAENLIGGLVDYAREYRDMDQLDHFQGDQDCGHCHLASLIQDADEFIKQ